MIDGFARDATGIDVKFLSVGCTFILVLFFGAVYAVGWLRRPQRPPAANKLTSKVSTKEISQLGAPVMRGAVAQQVEGGAAATADGGQGPVDGEQEAVDARKGAADTGVTIPEAARLPQSV